VKATIGRLIVNSPYEEPQRFYGTRHETVGDILCPPSLPLCSPPNDFRDVVSEMWSGLLLCIVVAFALVFDHVLRADITADSGTGLMEQQSSDVR